MQLRRERGDTFKVEIRVDESDIGHLYVMLGAGQGYIEVPALNQDYAKGMTLWLHNICREYAKKHFKKADVYSYARAKTEIREIVENELKLKRKKSHTKVARYKDTTQQPVDDVTNQKPKSATTRAKPIADNSVPLPLIASRKPRPSYTPIMDQRN